MQAPEPRIEALKAAPRGEGPVVFAVVRNEMYFLPHLLRHYRGLGIAEFWFLDDNSSDGTREYLLSQPDCGVLASDFKFGEMVGELRFGIAAKTLVPRQYFPGRWVLIVDADEFLVLPARYGKLGTLCEALDRAGIDTVRALMMDFFPRTMRALAAAPADAEPFEVAPFFDAFTTVLWRDGDSSPAYVSLHESVRPRMMRRLRYLKADMGDLLETYRTAAVNKVPLMRWNAQTSMLTAHRASQAPPDSVQLVLAHFKFYPGLPAKVQDALATKAYWSGSAEYRFLDVAMRELADWKLAGPATRRFTGAPSLETEGLLYSYLPR